MSFSRRTSIFFAGLGTGDTPRRRNPLDSNRPPPGAGHAGSSKKIGGCDGPAIRDRTPGYRKARSGSNRTNRFGRRVAQEPDQPVVEM